MSGIFGIAGSVKNLKDRLLTMSKILAHRGRDDEGLYYRDGFGMGCRLLRTRCNESSQPASNEDRSLRVVFDGALYNLDELFQLVKKGTHQVRNRSEAEIIAHLYEDHGFSLVDLLRGIFAFAVWDERNKQLILCRDHLGVKPLFYAFNDGCLYFASEVKAIKKAITAPTQIDFESLSHYLSLRFIPAPGTMIKGIKKLAPANLLIQKGSSVKTFCYWRPSFKYKERGSEETLITGLREKFRETVNSNIVGSTSVGAFLSGGLDSSLIVAMMARVLEEPFPTFSVGANSKEFDELPYARIVSKAFGTRQYETVAEIDLIRSLPEIIRCLDEPSDPVAAGKFAASKLAARHAKVVLGGDGGDELFAGFDRYRGVRYIGYYASIPISIRKQFIEKLFEFIPASFGYESISQKMRWINCVAKSSNVPERFAEAVSFFRFNHSQKQSLFCDNIWQQILHFDSKAILKNKYNESDAENIIEKMLYTDYTTRLPEHSLMLTDRLNMARGVEVRSPFVDKELVEYVAGFPLSMKIRRFHSKYAARKLGELELPKIISKRKKRGFRFPLAYWFARPLYPVLNSLFADSKLVSSGIFKSETISRLLQEHRDRKIDHNVRIWMLLNLEIWYRLLVDECGLEYLYEWLEKHYSAN